MKNQIVGSFAFLMTTLFVSNAFALSPSTSTLVSKVTIEAPYYYRIDNNTIYIGKEACERLVKEDSRVKITYATKINTLAAPGLYDGIFSFEVGRNSTARIDCSDRSLGLCSEINSTYIQQEASKIEVSIPFKELTSLTSPADCASEDTELFVRGEFRASVTDKTISSADAKFVIDAIGPAPPTLDSASATESTLNVALSGTPDKTTENYAVFYTEKPLTAGDSPDLSSTDYVLFGTRDTTRSQVNVTMEDGKTYNVALAAHDETGNYGPLSNVLSVKAVKTIDFWQAYLEAGGGDEGGCSTLPSSPFKSSLFELLLIVTGGILVYRRRNKTL